MKKLLAFFCILFIVVQSPAQKTDKKLQRQISGMVKGFNGDIGIYIKNLRNNKIISIQADTVFPTASMVKIPILIGVMDKIEKKNWMITRCSNTGIRFYMPVWTSLVLSRTLNGLSWEK